MSITLNSEWIEPRDPEDQSHWDAALRSHQFKIGMFAHPIFVNGDYPEVMKSMLKIDLIILWLTLKIEPPFLYISRTV